MSIHIDNAFPLLVLAGIACLLLPAPKAARYVVGGLAALYAILLALKAVSAAVGA